MSYTITRSHQCIVVNGAISLADLGALLTCWAQCDTDNEPAMPDDEWVVDGLLADELGVNLVCGPLHATHAWRKLLNIG